MALKRCKECGSEVSGQAFSCPNCGVPTPALDEDQVENIRQQGRFAQSRWFGGLLFFGGLAWLFFSAQSGGADGLSVLGRSGT